MDKIIADIKEGLKTGKYLEVDIKDFEVLDMILQEDFGVDDYEIIPMVQEKTIGIVSFI